VDDFSDEEKLEVCLSAFHISLDGWAIVDKDFIIKAVNSQWTEILGVLPDEFMGKSFVDITHPSIVAQDIANAKLVMQGKIKSYALKKTYQFSDSRQKNVVLLVVRVPISLKKPFMFFLSRILEDNENQEQAVKDLEAKVLSLQNQLELRSRPQWELSSLIDFCKKYAKWLFGAGIVLSGLLFGSLDADIIAKTIDFLSKIIGV
jgi:PAS domain S-box-containing protein